METSPLAFGSLLRQRRKLAGFKQTDVARHCGVSQSFISDVERGLKMPGEDLLDKIAQMPGFDRSEIISVFLSTPQQFQLTADHKALIRAWDEKNLGKLRKLIAKRFA